MLPIQQSKYYALQTIIDWYEQKLEKSKQKPGRHIVFLSEVDEANLFKPRTPQR
jgi:hypothetical protein